MQFWGYSAQLVLDIYQRLCMRASQFERCEALTTPTDKPGVHPSSSLPSSLAWAATSTLANGKVLGRVELWAARGA